MILLKYLHVNDSRFITRLELLYETIQSILSTLVDFYIFVDRVIKYHFFLLDFDLYQIFINKNK